MDPQWAVSSVSTIPRPFSHCMSLQCKWVVDDGGGQNVFRREHLMATLRRCIVRSDDITCCGAPPSLSARQDAERGVAKVCSAKSTGWP